MFESVQYWDPAAQFVLFSALKILVVFGVTLVFVSLSVVAERRVSAWIQDRVGPNRVGIPFTNIRFLGLGQMLADGLKFLLKEDFTPNYVRTVYFWLAPAITLIPAFLTLAVIPFGSTLGNPNNRMVIANLNVGILYTFGVVSLGVYGIVLAGYASNSKYPFLGGIRSSAQMISYEIAMGLSVIPIFLLVGSLNLGDVVGYQSGGLHTWLVWKQPLAFFIFLIAAFAETNRLPFDMPESESELIGGYHTEYSSMKFALFFLGEYANMIASCSMMVTLFFGGWTPPWGAEAATTLWAGLGHLACFLVKVIGMMLLFIWVRWMLPRFRYDQLMDLGWRRFIPIALFNILVTAFVVALWQR